MRKQVAVIGLGRFGISLVRTLFNLGHDVLAIDRTEKPIAAISSYATHVVQADATDESVLKELGIGSFNAAVVAIGTAIQSSVLTTILLKKLGVPYVIARAENDLHGSILEKIGADKVVYVEHEMGVSVAHGFALKDVSDYMPVSSRYGVVKLTVPEHYVGKNLSMLELGRDGKWGIAVLMIGRKKEVIIMPDTATTLQQDDILILSGEDDKLEKAFSQKETDAKEID